MPLMAAQELFEGRVVDMARVTDGSVLSVAAGIGDTVLQLEDVSDFDELGGQVQVDTTVYDYIEVDFDADTITLDTGLLAAADVDELVEIIDPELGTVVVEYVADVLLDEQDPSDAPIEVPVQHALVDLLAEAIRGGVTETVTLMRDGPDDFLIFQVDGKLATDLALEVAQEELRGGFNGSLQDIYDRADQAAADAAEAAATGTAALTAANGKNTNTYSSRAPVNGQDPCQPGDNWFVRSGSIVSAQYAGLGNAQWQSVALTNIVVTYLDAGVIGVGTAFTNALSVKTNFTLGDVDTNGVIQSYDFANSSLGVLIDKNGIVAKGGSLTGTTVRTSSGSLGGYVELSPVSTVGVGGSLRFNVGGVTVGTIENWGTGSIWRSADGAFSIGLPANSGTGSNSIGVVGKAVFNDQLHGREVWIDNLETNGNSPNTFVGPGGKLWQATGSSRRFKDNILDIDFDLAAAMRLVHGRQFTYKPDYYDDPTRVFWGDIAEELVELGLDKFVDFDEDEQPSNVRYGQLGAVGVLALAQHNADRIDAVEARLSALEGAAV